MTGVNFIPTHLRQRRRALRRRRAWAIALAAYAALAVAGCAAWRVGFVPPAPPRVAQDVERLRAEAESKSARAAAVRAELADARAALRVTDAMVNQPDWGLLLALLGKARGEDVTLRRCELYAPAEVLPADVSVVRAPPEPPRSVLRVQGIGQSQAAVSRFAMRLEQTGLFDSIEPSSSREAFDGREVVAFKMECRLTTTSTRPTSPRPGGIQAGVEAAGVLP